MWYFCFYFLRNSIRLSKVVVLFYNSTGKTGFPVSFSMSLPTLVFPILLLIFFFFSLMVAILMGVR